MPPVPSVNLSHVAEGLERLTDMFKRPLPDVTGDSIVLEDLSSELATEGDSILVLE